MKATENVGIECKLPDKNCPYQSCMGTNMCQFHEVIKHGAPEWEAPCGKDKEYSTKTLCLTN